MRNETDKPGDDDPSLNRKSKSPCSALNRSKAKREERTKRKHDYSIACLEFGNYPPPASGVDT